MIRIPARGRCGWGAMSADLRVWLFVVILVFCQGCSRHATEQEAAPKLRADLLTKTLWKTRSGDAKEVQVLFNRGVNGQIRCNPGKGERRFDFVYKLDLHDQVIKLRLEKERGTAKLTEDSRLSFKIGAHDYLLEPEARPAY